MAARLLSSSRVNLLRSITKPSTFPVLTQQFSNPLPRLLSTKNNSSTANDKNSGTMSRTDNQVQIDHPSEQNTPSSTPYSGHGGAHDKRTLASFSLQDRTVVITGGARGLGLVMAQACVISGANVALVDLNEEESRKQASAILEHFRSENPHSETTPTITAHYTDVSSETSVNDCIESILSQHSGKIDHLITSAGFTENFTAEKYPLDRMRKLWAVNVDGTYLFATSVARHLMARQASGSMVFVGSMSGAIVNVPQPQTPYNASKAAVRHLAASLAVEWAHAGIRVNCISPGYMLTALTRKIMDENPKLRDQWISLIPSGKMGSPQDLMGAVVYLLSDAAAYTTGADLRIDGGYTCT